MRVKIEKRLYFILFPRQPPALHVVCLSLVIKDAAKEVTQQQLIGNNFFFLFCTKSAYSVLLPLKTTYQSGEVAQKTTKSVVEPNTKRL